MEHRCRHEPCKCEAGTDGYCSDFCREHDEEQDLCRCGHTECRAVSAAAAVERTEPEEAAEEGYPMPTTAGDLMRADPVAAQALAGSDVVDVDEKMPASKVARRLHATGSTVAVVLRDGERVGIVTSEDVNDVAAGEDPQP